MTKLSLVAILALVLSACTGGSQDRGAADAGENSPDAEPQGEDYGVLFETSAGSFIVDVTRSWSPNGADRFGELVDAGYYEGCRFFRVVPGFMVQFGINGVPATQAMWTDATIADDPVVESNLRGYISFAQTAEPNSRSTQLFINYVDNSFLDAQNFAPFGVIRSGGMEAVDAINSEYGEAPDQTQIINQGTPYLDANFPNLDFIETANRVPR